VKPAEHLVHAAARVLAKGRQIISAEAVVRDREGRVLAHGTSTMLVLNAPGESQRR
jgi:acyl-coenzyme A thioesterase PaaI-like protein